MIVHDGVLEAGSWAVVATQVKPHVLTRLHGIAGADFAGSRLTRRLSTTYTLLVAKGGGNRMQNHFSGPNAPQQRRILGTQ
jgi:hypothetical protein